MTKNHIQMILLKAGVSIEGANKYAHELLQEFEKEKQEHARKEVEDVLNEVKSEFFNLPYLDKRSITRHIVMKRLDAMAKCKDITLCYFE